MLKDIGGLGEEVPARKRIKRHLKEHELRNVAKSHASLLDRVMAIAAFRAEEIRGADGLRDRLRGRHPLRAGEIRGAEIRGAELRGRLRSRLRSRLRRRVQRRLQRRLRSVQKSARVAARALAATAEFLSRMECAGLGAAMLAIVALPRLTRLGRIVKIVVN